MILTEEEAKTKNCCGDQSCGAWLPQPPVPGQPQKRVCIGSQCMAWRWVPTPEWEQKADREYRRSGTRLPPKYGYCGLAGKLEE